MSIYLRLLLVIKEAGTALHTCRSKAAEGTDGTDLTYKAANTVQWRVMLWAENLGIMLGCFERLSCRQLKWAHSSYAPNGPWVGEHLQHAVLQHPAEATAACLDKVSRHDIRVKREHKFHFSKLHRKVSRHMYEDMRIFMSLHKFSWSAQPKCSPCFLCHERN